MLTYTETSGLAALVGTRTAGTWRLRVREQFREAGSINSWSITVTSPGAAPTFGTETIFPQQYTTEVAITPLTLPAAAGGDGTLSYSIVEALPDGLSFDATTRILSGIPSVGTEQAASRYTYRAEDSDGDAAGLLFTIAIRPRVTFGSATIAPQNYSAGIPITLLTLPEASGGNPPLSYSIVEPPPEGLSFDATTRTLSGTPAAGQRALTYTYRVADADGVAVTLRFTIAISDEPVATDHTADLYRNPSAPNTPTVTIDFNDLIADGTTSDANLGVTLPFADPGVELVSGGTLESSDGTLKNRVLTLDSTKLLEVSSVAGTDLAPHTFRYTVTDEDRNTDSANLILLIDERPSISVANREFTVENRSITVGGGPNFSDHPFSSLVDSHRPHGEEEQFAVRAPNLANAGRFISSGGHVIYTFSADFAGRSSGMFTIGLFATATSIANAIIPPLNAAGALAVAGDLLVSDTATFTFIIPNTAPVIMPPSVPAYLLNEDISLIFTADDENGHPVTFSLEAGAGAVPTGAAIAPTEAQAVPEATATLTWTTPPTAGTYTFDVVADDGQADNNRATYPLTLEVAADTTPTFGTASLAAQTYVVGNAIDPLTLPAATDGNGALSYGIIETLPQGLSFNPNTRVLSGTPDTAQSAVPYTYRVQDADSNLAATDRADLRFDITIEADTNPGFGSDTITPQSYTAGEAITPLTLPAATGGNAPLSHTLARTTGTPALPPGLSFDAGNRVLSDTPTTTQVAATYTYRVRDADGDVAELTFTITIIGAPPSALDHTADLYRNPDAPTTPTVTINFNDLIADSTTADADLEVKVTLPFANPGVRLVSGGTQTNNVLTLNSAQMLEVSSVAGTDLAVHEFDYTVTDEDGNTATATLTLRIDERPTLSYANAEFTVTNFSIPAIPSNGRFIRLGTDISSGRELLTPASSHRPHGEELGVVAVPDLANAFGNPFTLLGDLIGVDYFFDPRFTGRVGGTFTVGLYATDASIANTIIPLMNAGGVDPATAGDLLISASATFTFIVPSAPPEITPPIVANPYPPNQEIELIFSVTDTEGHELIFTLAPGSGEGGTPPPVGAIFVPPTPQAPPANATFTWTPTDADAGTYRFDVVATETTTAVNTAPATSRPEQVMLVVSSPLSFGGVATGSVAENDSDNTADGRLTLTDPGGVAQPFAAQTNVSGTYGSFEIATNGVWTYTLNNRDSDTNRLAEDATVTDVFTVAANAQPSATQFVTITITGANDAPTATISAPLNNVEVGTSTVVTLTGTGSDPDTGDTVTLYAWSASPAQGSFADASMADTTWTAPSDVGNVDLTLTVTDGNDATDTATITVRVVPVPVTITGRVTGAVTEDSGSNRATGDLNIDTTAALNTFVPQTDASGTYGTFSIDADGMWNYQIDNSRTETQNLAEGAMANDVFTVVAAARATATAIVTITVTGANEQPTASISAPTDGATVNAGVPVPLTGTGTDVDTGDPAFLSYQWNTTPPNQGSFANATLATTTWTPSATAVGTDVTLTLTVTDASGAANDSATARVTVGVTAVSLTISGDTTGTVTEDDNANNVASGALSIATDLADKTFVPQTNVSGTYGTFSIDADGGWNYRLDNADVDTQALASDATASDVFTARANARPGVTQAVTLTVTGANDAPTVTIDAPADDTATSIGTPVTLTATGADVDTGDEAGLRYQWSTSPPNRGSFGNATAANTTWTAPTTPGNVTLTLTVTDTSGAANDTATATVTLSIVTTMFLPDLSGNGDLQASDAQILYYLGLPPSASRTRLLDSLGVSAGMVDQVNARAQNWQNQEPLSDLNGNGESDRQDAQILYYTARFGPLLEVSPTLLQAVLGDLARNPTAALNNARRLLNR